VSVSSFNSLFRFQNVTRHNLFYQSDSIRKVVSLSGIYPDERDNFNNIPYCMGILLSGHIFQITGVNFINILWAAFAPVDPKSVKRYWQLDWILTLLGATGVKAVHKYVGEIEPRSCYQNMVNGTHLWWDCDLSSNSLFLNQQTLFV